MGKGGLGMGGMPKKESEADIWAREVRIGIHKNDEAARAGQMTGKMTGTGSTGLAGNPLLKNPLVNANRNPLLNGHKPKMMSAVDGHGGGAGASASTSKVKKDDEYVNPMSLPLGGLKRERPVAAAPGVAAVVKPNLPTRGVRDSISKKSSKKSSS